MKRLLIITFVALVTVACSRQNRTSTSAASNEKTYPMTATIVSRDPAKNTLNLDNKEVPGKMAAMKMDYEVRGAKVSELPPRWCRSRSDGARRQRHVLRQRCETKVSGH